VHITTLSVKMSGHWRRFHRVKVWATVMHKTFVCCCGQILRFYRVCVCVCVYFKMTAPWMLLQFSFYFGFLIFSLIIGI
jgi:hypothetical protein